VKDFVLSPTHIYDPQTVYNSCMVPTQTSESGL